MRKLAIIGASGHGKVIADIARKNGYKEIVFLDDNENIQVCGNYPVIGESAKAENMDADIIIGIGNASIRKRIQEIVPEANLVTLIHPNAVVAEDVMVGAGTVIMAGAVINPGTKIGKGCIINTCASVDHDCDIGDYVHVAVASMLEVGTGFHPELTGRENIYMNGAILGMTKSEIDTKMEDIIEFSECRQFIDTPVKRYSSGMYVKLAFSVAAHLDSEILIMDEVLAVGDMAFQTKCLEKMSDVSKKEGRTILYVSHNMNTIRQLCDRCVVLDHGTVIFDGDVEKAIAIYSHVGDLENIEEKNLTNVERYCEVGKKGEPIFVHA